MQVVYYMGGGMDDTGPVHIYIYMSIVIEKSRLLLTSPHINFTTKLIYIALRSYEEGA